MKVVIKVEFDLKDSVKEIIGQATADPVLFDVAMCVAMLETLRAKPSKELAELVDDSGHVLVRKNVTEIRAKVTEIRAKVAADDLLDRLKKG